MSINFNAPLKAQRKSSPLKHYSVNLTHKHSLPLKEDKQEHQNCLPLSSSEPK